jgi:hypothetical protein
MTRQDLIALNAMISREEPETFTNGVRFILSREGTDYTPADPNEALAYLTAFLHALLSADRYVDAALFLWGERTFDPKPKSVNRIWKAMDDHDKLLCLGGGAQSKTYTPTVKVFLRWIEDPQYTTVKLVSTTGGHAKGNIFAGFVKLHNEACIPLPGLVRENYIALSINDMLASIEKVSIKDGENGRAALRGFHRMPRKTPHPKFGDMSWIFVIVDEADNVPWGFWTGADNIASGRGDAGGIKIYGATNPVLRESEFAVRAEPRLGWSQIDRDKTFEWKGKQGWYAIRLDVRQSENYIEKREVCKGMMTYQSAKEYEEKGLDHPDYWSFVMGLYPAASAKYYVVPAFIFDNIRGTYNFTRTPYNVASFDSAFEKGGDRPVLTTGRYGLANGWRDPQGKFEKISPTRWALQIEQQFAIEKKANPLDMADNLIAMLRKLRVSPEWFAFDQTGNATLLYGYFLRHYGVTMGLKWGSKATDKKIFEEDTETGEKQFVGLISDMWFGFSRWAQFGYVKIAPMMQTQELFNETSSRKYEQVGKSLMKVESKDDFKANNGGKSPDFSDSLIMSVHICRIKGSERASMMAEEPKRPIDPDVWTAEGWSPRGQESSLHSVVDNIKFINFDGE